MHSFHQLWEPPKPRATVLIHIDNLCKSYRHHVALKGLTFDLPPGSVCGFVGPNGAGKTTTLRCIGGLISADSGRIEVDGFSASGVDPDYKRKVVYVPDDPPLLDDLTVGDHMELIGRLYDTPDRAAQSDRLLEQFSLDVKRDASGGELSRGMRQKLAICCAALASPTLMLLDEPLTGLDPPGIRQLLDSIRQWTAGENRKSIMISSHLLAMIADVCTHVLVMAGGERQFFGTIDQMRAAYPDAATLEDAYFAATCTA